MAVNCDPNVLVGQAACLSCIPEGMRMAVLNYLLCQIANQSGGGGGGSGTVTNFSAGNLSPLFTSSVANPTTTPALTFAQVAQAANLVFAGPASGVAANPMFRALVANDLSGIVSPAYKIGVPFGMVGPFVANAATTYAANTPQTCLFVVEPAFVTISNIYWSLTANTLAQFVGFSIYNVTPGSSTRGTRIADTGPIDVNVTPIGPVKSALGPVTLASGVYCLAFNASAATVTVLGAVPGGGTITSINAYNGCPEVFYGSAANAAAAGQNPALLGVITGNSALHFPVVLLGN